MSRTSRVWRPADGLSLSRLLFGAIVLVELSRGQVSFLVLPAVALACASDYLDGRLARGRGEDSPHGLLIDNLADAAFLALAFWGMALAEVWSRPPFGRALEYFAGANWLPLIALGLSFSTYLVRIALAGGQSSRATRSPRGHAAGVANYVLALLGGAAVLPGLYLSPYLLEPAFLTVSLMNLSGALENLRLLAAGPRPR